MPRTIALAVLASSLVVTTAHAQVEDRDANLNLHLTLASYAGCDDTNFDVIDEGTCSDLSGGAVAGQAFVWVVASKEGGLPDGIGGVQFGIQHSGVIQNWALCTGGSQIAENGWPASGTGNACVFDDGCYVPAGEAARIGFFGVDEGATGSYRLTDDPRIAQAVWADCSTETFTYCEGNLGRVDHGSGTTQDPRCGDRCDDVIPNRATTWTSIKAHFDR